MTLDRATLAGLRAALADRPADRLGAVVALVDRLAERGDVDALIAPFRPAMRSGVVACPRPASLGRLFALPFEPLLVHPADWQRGDLTIPRSALRPMIAIVTERLAAGPLSALAADLNGRLLADPEVVNETGPKLWVAAADILRPFGGTAPLPPTAGAIPMLEPLFRSFCAAVADLLRIGRELIALNPALTASDPWQAVRRALDAAAAPTSPALYRRVALIALVRFGHLPGVPLLVRDHARNAGLGDVEEAIGQVLDATVATLERAVAQEREALLAAPLGDVRGAVALVERLAALLDDRLQMRNDARRDAISALGRACEAMLEEVLTKAVGETLVHDVLAVIEQGGPVSAFERFETSARAASELAAAAQRLAPRAGWPDAVLRRAAEAFLDLGRHCPPGLPPDRPGKVDLARLVEILAGPERAMPLLA